VFTSPRLLISSVAAALVMCVVATPAAPAAKGGSKPAASPLQQQMSLVSEYVWNSPNPTAPTWCMDEDDWHVRTWTGALNGSFATTEALCDEGTDGSDAGGIGLQADLIVAGAYRDFAITAPDGSIHHAVFTDSTTSKGATLNHYRVCYVPPFMLVNNIGFGSLPGGIWQVALSGEVTNVSLTLRARMADVRFQQTYCPPSQQNLH
jgi:hypothetical protein